MTVSDEARELLADCARQFRHYEELHRAKGTPEAYEKSKANGAFAHRIECFLSAGVDYESQRPSPHDEGVPPEFREEVWTAVHSATVTGSAADVTEATVRICEAVSALRAPKLDEGVIAEVKEALRWAIPLAERALEEHRLQRIKAGHQDIRGEDERGSVVVGLRQSEIDERTKARRLLTLIEGGGE